VLISAGFLLLVAIFALLLLAPFEQPKTVWIGGWIDYSAQVPNARFVPPLDIVHLRRFMPNDSSNTPAQGRLLSWRGDETLSSWQEFVGPLSDSSDDVAIIYLNVQGVVVEKHAEILQNGFRPGQAEAARLSVSNLITTLQSLPQQVKLLVLEAGHITTDPALGVADNRFAEEFQRTLLEIEDSSIWVLLSHRSGERAWVSPVLQQSVFTHFVTEALSGRADHNRDATVSVGELAAYVVPQVENHVRSLSRGQHVQTPQLICGDAVQLAKADDVPVLYLASIADRSAVPNANTIVPPLGWTLLTKTAAGTPSPSPALTPAPAAQASPSTTGPAVDRVKAQVEKQNRERQNAAQVLMRAWHLRDRINELPAANATAYEPHRWRAFQQQLLGLEQRLRLNTEESWADVAWELGKACDDWERKNFPVESRTRSENEVAKPAPASQTAAATGNSAAPVKLDAAAAWVEYQSRWEVGKTKELRAWLQQNAQSDWEQNEHLAWAVSLAVNSLVDDELFAVALKARHLAAELANQGKAIVDWCYPQWLAAERQRQLGEQHLRDYYTPTRCEFAREALTQSLASYHETATRLKAIADADHLWRSLMSRAPDYLEWFVLGQGDDGLWAPRFDDLAALYEHLRRLSDMFDVDGEKSYDVLQQTVAQLALLHDIVERPLADDAIAHLVEPEKTATHLCEIETLLSVALPKANCRAKLLDAVEVGRKRWGKATSVPTASARDDDRQELQSALRIARLQLGLISLATTGGSKQRERVTQAIAQIDQGATELANSTGDELLQTPSELTAKVSATLEHASATQRKTYHNLVKRCEELFLHANSDDYRTSAASFAELRRALYLIDPRDVVPPLDDSLSALAVQLADYEANSLRYTSQRFEGCDLSGAAYERWSEESEELRTLAMGIFPSPILPLPHVEPLQLDGPSSLSLLQDPQRQLVLRLKGRTVASGPVWIVLDYDASSIDVKLATSLKCYHSDELAWSTALPLRSHLELSLADNSADDRMAHLVTWHQALRSLPPSLDSPTGETIQLPLLISRRELGQGPTRCVIRVISKDSLARHTVDVELPGQPPVHVVVQGLEGTVSDSATGPRLHPWPNRPTEYQFSLQNRTTQSRTIDATFFALPTELSGAQAAALMQQTDRTTLQPDLGNPIATMTGIAIPAGGECPLPWPKHAAKLPVKPKMVTKDGQSPVDGKGTASLPPAIPGDLLCMIVDAASGEHWYQPIEFSVQRPRNYVSVQAKFDAATNTVSAIVRANDVTTLPPKGILVRGYFGEQISAAVGPDKSLQAILQAPTGEVQLRGTVPKAIDQRQYFYIDVDEFPRAFILKLPSSPTQFDMYEAWEYAAVRILGPKPGEIVGDLRDSVDVSLRVDAPPGLLAQADNGVEISLDVQRDRNSNNDSVKRLRSDRQTQTWLLEMAPNGRFVCHSSVTDVGATISTVGIRNVRAMVRATMQLNDQLVRAEPIEIVFDGQGPEISELTVINPKMVPRGLVAHALVTTNDHQLSGVAKVEAMWDLQQTGAFPAAANTILGTHELGVGWHLTVPATDLPLGQQTLLVRATDRAGNVSRTAATTVEIVDPELLKRMPVVVRGKVLYEGKVAAEADVELTDDMGKVLPKVITASDGSFEVPGVVPGNYSISAVIYVRNLPRRTTRKLIVAPIYEVAKPITLAVP
jgi:hypothetical protein